MRALVRLADILDAIVTWAGRIGAWASIPLIGIIIFDVVTRRFFVLGSTKLQEAEWHIHAILFLLCIGMTYIKDTHVRIDLVRENLSIRTQRWIELIGCLIFLIPYCAIVLYFSLDFVDRSWSINESSDSATGLPYRWAIKAFLPIGFFLMLLAGITVALRKFIELFGPPDLRELVEAEEAEEIEHLEDVKVER
ncbi:TRAP transporter small permease subunit [Pelagibius sp.]|uniref:TRAP transporter small permease subunit n=1 Tax=Pelagibius sp. TaxID=1931238 RepID=UPI002636F4FC|nr:TRAP transporter small permease subunit [Pelagibius sp.]